MRAQNLVFIMSDEHDPRHMGCYGSAVVRTPNLDKLAARGTRFTSAYTSCPICVPARASWATGQYVHRIRYWDNAMGYDGAIPGWGHRLQAAGIRVESIGKLHYTNEDAPTGFDKQTDPMHIFQGIGQVWGSIRNPLPIGRTHKMIKEIGAGESSYNRYDKAVADSAANWLRDAAANHPKDQPFVLYLGFVAPHFPFVVPQEFFDLYQLDSIPLPTKLHPSTGYQRHPWLEDQAVYAQNDEPLTDEDRRACIAAYYGLCTYLDHHIGRVLDVLDETGLSQSTRVVYTSDHGENLGVRGTWGKSNLYQEATRIPLILAGPDVPEGKVCRTAANFVDYYHTILDAAGQPTTTDAVHPGASLWSIADAPDDPHRTSFSEYHAVGAPSGAFMLRRGRWKYHYYVGYPPELFDLDNDPEETDDLAGDPAHAATLAAMAAALRAIVDPEAAHEQALADQAALIARFGGRDAALGLGTPGATPPPVA
jgi:choline-sulfatase